MDPVTNSPPGRESGRGISCEADLDPGGHADQRCRWRTRRVGKRDPAASPGAESNVIGGRLPPLTRPTAMISFIVPAHNEELWVGKCLGSIRTTMEKLAGPYEVIVVDDASTDATPRIARQLGARTLRVEHRKISAVRNAGARAANGEVFFFVDADTQVNDRAVEAALGVLRAGATGGGCLFEFDGPIPVWARVLHRIGVELGRRIRWVGGCFLFCTREAYRATGGFAEDLRAGEDIAFCQALKKVGRFVVPKPTVISSGRKLGVVGPWEVLGFLLRIAVRGPRYQDKMILDILYGQRAQDSKTQVQAAERPKV